MSISKGTLVNTPIGLRKIEDIKIGDDVCSLIHRGFEGVSKIEINKNIEVYKVSFSDGGEQVVTESHRYLAQKAGYSQEKITEALRLDELTSGDYVLVKPAPLLDKKIDLNAFSDGVFIGILLASEFNKEITNVRGVNKSCVIDFLHQKGLKTIESENIEFDKESHFAIKDIKAEDVLFYSEKYKTGGLYSFYLGVFNGVMLLNGILIREFGFRKFKMYFKNKKNALYFRDVLIMIGIYSSVNWLDRNFYLVLINAQNFNLASENYVLKMCEEIYNQFHGNTNIVNDEPVFARINSIIPFGKNDVFDLKCCNSGTYITSGYIQEGL